MTYIPLELRRAVRDKAKDCCEYCLINEIDNLFSHEIDHIVPVKHKGPTSIDNLCLSCFDCNRYKGSNVGSYDTETANFTPLFHPRRDVWEEHFHLDNGKCLSLTAIARVTIDILNINSDERIKKRQELIDEGRYPCVF